MKQWKSGSLINKTIYSLNGIYYSFISENAVRREFGALVILFILCLWRGKNLKTIFAVFLAGLFPIIIELINTACEAIIDMFMGPIYREDVKHAKDMLSAAVMLSLLVGHGAALILIFG